MKRLIGVIVLLTGLFAAGVWNGEIKATGAKLKAALRGTEAPADAGGHAQPFTKSENLAEISRDWSMAAICAIGAGIVIIAGGIDLSIGAVAALSGMLFGSLLIQAKWPLVPAALVVLAVAMAFGWVQGMLVTRGKLQPFIVTLAGMMIARGAAAMFDPSGSLTLLERHAEFKWAAGYLPGSFLMWPMVFMLVIAVAAIWFQHFTVWGRHLYAAGRNEQAALYSGINVVRLRTLTYVVSAGLAGVAGLLYSADLARVSYTDCSGYELWAVAGAVLGGVSLRGGEGTVPGMLLGALTFPLLRRVMTFLELPSNWEFAFVGIVLLAAVVLDELIRRQEARSAARKRV